jgi:hypothetical protein
MRRDLLDVFGRSGNAPAMAPHYHFVRVDEAWLTRASGLTWPVCVCQDRVDTR